MDNECVCRSFFKSGESNPGVENYTQIWIMLINQIERSKAILAGVQ